MLTARQRKKFQRMIPLLFRQSRVVQAGEPLKVSEAQKQCRLWWFQCFRMCNRVLLTVLACVSITMFFVFSIEKAISFFSMCMMIGLYLIMIEWIGRRKNYVPLRWIIVRDGIWLQSSRDVSRFLPWRSIVQIDTEPNATEPNADAKLDRLALVTDMGERESLKTDSNLLPFVNKLLGVLPHHIDPEPLLLLQRRLRHDVLYSVLYLLRDTYLAFGFALTVPVYMLLNFCFPAAEVGFEVWMAIMGVTLLISIGIYILIRRAVVRRHAQHVEQLQQELDETDVTAILHAAKSPHHEFGLPPRSISPQSRRVILFSDENALATLLISAVMAGFTLLFGGILWFDDTVNIRDILFMLLGFELFFGVIFLILVYANYSESKRIMSLLETSKVVKYRIRKRFAKVKTVLTPVGGVGEPLEIKSQVGSVGETVHVFYDEAKPKNSFVVESYRGEIRFDSETGEIECGPDPFVKYAKWSLVALALGIAIIVLRIVWVW